MIIFYTSTSRNFRTTLIGYLYEICKIYPVLLVSEELDYETEEILNDKELFPKLEKIIKISEFVDEKASPFIYNKEVHKFLKNIIYQYKPEIIISSGDMYSLFEMYLMRFGKRIGALKIAFQTTNTGENAIGTKLVDLVNAYLRFPSFLPFQVRLFLVNFRKYLGHFFYYWFLPLTTGEKPFFGKSSYILRKGKSGMRDADCQVIFSKKDCEIYHKEGVLAEKLYILPHPLVRNRDFFKRAYFTVDKKQTGKIVVVMLPSEMEFGFKRENLSVILNKEREKEWIEVVKLMNEILPKWKIYIKPHPGTKDIDKVKKTFEQISKNLEIVQPKEPPEKYIEMANLIVELPLSASTVLFTAFLWCPEKPILSLDFHHELLGDYYKNFDGIQYIDNQDNFLKTLKLIRDNKYQKKNAKKPEPQKFLNSVELLDYLLSKKNEQS